MNFRFIAADSLQKVIVIVVLVIWSRMSSKASLEWSITFFSLSTLPNTLVMGVPLLRGMYGEFTESLMGQIVFFQSVIWYNLLLFLFEYRGAKLLIKEQFRDTGSSIISFKVDSDVMSLDGKEPLEAQVELQNDGSLHVTIKKSISCRSEGFSRVMPMPSNFDEESCGGGGGEISSLGSVRVDVNGYRAPPIAGIFSPSGKPVVALTNKGDGKGFQNYVRSSSAPPVSRGSLHVFKGGVGGGGHDLGRVVHPKDYNYDDHGKDEISLENRPGGNRLNGEGPTLSKSGSSSNTDHSARPTTQGESRPTSMPSAGVMTRLILTMVWRKLIRNPNTYATLIGLIWSLISFRWHVKMPAIIASSIAILSNTGLGMAMFSLGFFMALQPSLIACGKKVAAFSMAVRFLIGPATMAATSAAVGLRGVLLRIAIVQAVLPQGIVPFVFAKEYNVHASILSTAVIFGMLIALPITLVYYILLGL